MNKLTVDYLIKLELEGKAHAVNSYDSFIWKIRTAFALFFYGIIATGATLIEKEKMDFILNHSTPVLIVMFAFIILCSSLDFSFLTKKLKVVQARNKLIELSLFMTQNKSIEENKLKDLLMNSGEKKDKINWKVFTSFEPLLLIYLPPILILLIFAIWK